MRFHVLGLPNTISSKDFKANGLVLKIVLFCRMMTQRGHTVYHYGHELSEVEASESVPVVDNGLWQAVYGNTVWRQQNRAYHADDRLTAAYTHNTIKAIEARKKDGDLLMVFGGALQKPICDHFSDMAAIEAGIDHEYTHWSNHLVFESYAMYHAYLGMRCVAMCYQNNLDVVIPKCFDADDFVFSAQKDEYFLYCGNVRAGKGAHIAIQLTEAAAVPLVIVGGYTDEDIANLGYGAGLPRHVQLKGYVNDKDRSYYLSRAKATLVLPRYIEPFGDVAIESQLSGTPVISFDWGAHAENNIHEITGYRCRTLDHFIWAVKHIDRISPQDCRDWAFKNFTYQRLARSYEEYAQMVVDSRKANGDMIVNHERRSLTWLLRQLPGQAPLVDHQLLFLDRRQFAGKLAHWVQRVLRPRSVIDYGCGLGALASAFDALTIPCLAVDRAEQYRVLSLPLADGRPHKPSLRPVLPVAAAVAPLKRFVALDIFTETVTEPADITFCLELGGMIDSLKESMLVTQLAKSLRPMQLLIWCAPPPGVDLRLAGVDETSYIHWRPKQHWLSAFERCGLQHLPTLERQLLTDFGGWAPPWFAQGLLVLMRPHF